MIDIRPNIPWTDEAEQMLLRALALDPLADMERERDAVFNRRATLFGVYDGAELLGCFTGTIARSEQGDEFMIGPAAARDEGRALTLETVSAFERLAREGLCGAVRADIFNPRLFPVMRRAGYAPLYATVRKVL